MRKVNGAYVERMKTLNHQDGDFRSLLARVSDTFDKAELAEIYTSMGVGIGSVAVKIYNDLVTPDGGPVVESINDRENIREDIMVIVSELTYTLNDRLNIDVDMVIDAARNMISMLFPYIPVNSTGYIRPDDFRTYNLRTTTVLEYRDRVVEEVTTLLSVDTSKYVLKDGTIRPKEYDSDTSI